MGVRIIIAGESQCDSFAKACLVADYLSKNLPTFCYERIEKPVVEWKPWLCKFNAKNKWHHNGSPLVWKELLLKGSKPYYIGGAADFLDYCYSYYQFQSFMSTERFKSLITNFNQYTKKLNEENNNFSNNIVNKNLNDEEDKNNIVICISGASHPITMYIISGLLEMSLGPTSISKIYVYENEEKCTQHFFKSVEHELSYVATNFPGKIVRCCQKVGMALAHSDLLIILDHEPFSAEISIGEWLYINRQIMTHLSFNINASASPNLRIIFPNMGPACYNATLVTQMVNNINKNNIVVVTSDLGLNLISCAAQIAEVPVKSMFCPPVWGFVGINHLVDIKTTIHKYNVFDPLPRYNKVSNSTLCIGTLTPELRTMEYLLYFDENLWTKIAEKQKLKKNEEISINKATVIVNFIKLWLLYPNSEHILSLGIMCDGAFGLSFKGIFSQPAKLQNGYWKPATDYFLPKDPQMNIQYLEKIAKIMMNLKRNQLPQVISYCPCLCKRKNKIKSRNN